ncbi:MAG: CHASE2 domain-containing protein, partial [Steroidobacteraceae bacterium]|nr:CHASE2 domain-containing protein [Steroidobacteraceae bacterium]
MLRRAVACLGLALLPLFALLPHSLGWVRYGFVERTENYLYDLRLRATLPGRGEPGIVIVDIDEKSLAAEGHWPWPRDKLANLVDLLFDHYEIRVLGFDVTWPEPEENSAARLLTELAQQPQWRQLAEGLQVRYQTDRRFAEALVARNVVMGFVFKSAVAPGQPPELGALPAPLEVSGAVLDKVPWVEARGFTGNLPLLQQNALTGGFFDTPLVDEDGVIRRMPLLQRYRGRLYESLALAVARVARDGAPLQFAFRGDRAAAKRLDYAKLGDTVIPVDERAAFLLPFRGPVGSFAYIPATDVLRQQAPADMLRDAIVLLGS